ncbi:MAG TPA: hypothetical protein VK862_06375 [Afifellaceae bacterium]|nr:hypothetical protein [Afifellaceae bacterium]
MASKLFESLGWFRTKHSKQNCDLQANIRDLQDPQSKTRRDARIATYQHVDICSEHGEVLVEATIRDLSKYGALLQLKSQKKLPARLLVRSPVEHSVNVATLKWKSARSAGVEFDEQVSVPKSPPDLYERTRVISSYLASNSTIAARGETGSTGPNRLGGLLLEARIHELLRGDRNEPAGCP